ncbi:MAG: peptidylprolyl isomerase [Bdellovibrionales bacterium]
MTFYEKRGKTAAMRFLTFFALLTLVAPAYAADEPVIDIPSGQLIGSIVATVNDDVITAIDLRERLALAFFTSNIEPTPENQQRLLPQVMRSLIDETLQKQEAERLGISVSPEEMKAASAKLANDNKIPADQLDEILKARGVPPRTLQAQIEAALLWSKVIQRKLRPLVEVGDEEVDARIERLQENAGKPEYLVAEIFLRVDDPSQEADVENFANGLVTQIQQGAGFQPIAQQFSQGAGALQGGDLGWVMQGQLPTELDDAVNQLGGTGLTPPIRSPSGYHILLVRDTRISAGADLSTLQVRLSQVFVPDSGKLDNDVAAVRRNISGCSTLKDDVTAVSTTAQVRDLGMRNLSELPDWLGQLVQGMSEGDSSEPYAIGKGALLVVLCDRKIDGGTGINREQITAQIGTERLELQARRLLRDLRSEAIVDVRN